jgi:hypothetical protein
MPHANGMELRESQTAAIGSTRPVAAGRIVALQRTANGAERSFQPVTRGRVIGHSQRSGVAVREAASACCSAPQTLATTNVGFHRPRIRTRTPCSLFDSTSYQQQLSRYDGRHHRYRRRRLISHCRPTNRRHERSGFAIGTSMIIINAILLRRSSPRINLIVPVSRCCIGEWNSHCGRQQHLVRILHAPPNSRGEIRS